MSSNIQSVQALVVEGDTGRALVRLYDIVKGMDIVNGYKFRVVKLVSSDETTTRYIYVIKKDDLVLFTHRLVISDNDGVEALLMLDGGILRVCRTIFNIVGGIS